MRSRPRSTELAALLARVAVGDQAAFESFYTATSRSVFGIVVSVVRDRSHAEEVTQEVYVEAWRQAPRFDPGQGSPSAWLNTIAHRRAVDRVRSAHRSTERERRHAASSGPPVVADTSDIVVAGDEGERLRAALADLPEAQRVALQLAYFEGRSHSDIASHLQIPLGTVKTRIRDAMRKLRDRLGEEAP